MRNLSARSIHYTLCLRNFGASRLPLSRRDEDAERVAFGVGVHVEALLRVVGTVEEELCPEAQRPFVLRRQRLLVRHRQIEVRLLRYLGARPRGARQLRHVLERQARCPRGVDEHDVVLALRVVLPGRWCLVTRPVVVAEELPVELGQAAGSVASSTTVCSAGNAGSVMGGAVPSSGAGSSG